MILLWLFFVFVFTVGVADPKHYPLNPEDMCFSVWGLPSHSHMFQLFEDAENLFFFDTVTNSATESITKVPRPGKFDMRLACRPHLLRWALTQGCGTKGQEILAALTHGLTVYVKFLTHVWKGQYLNIVLYRSSGIGLYINIIMFDKTMLTHF